jgi:hypothetical protein
MASVSMILAPKSLAARAPPPGSTKCFFILGRRLKIRFVCVAPEPWLM